MNLERVEEFVVSPELGFNAEALALWLYSKNRIKEPSDNFFRIDRRSVDARGKVPKVNLKLRYFEESKPPFEIDWKSEKLPYVANSPAVIVIGAGPAGMFAALQLIEIGLKPILIERGKDVRARRRDLAAINKEHIVNSESNYCFGEGGAGTYSDGKLYTRSHKRGDIKRILEILVAHGGKEDILIEAHPHIGTNKLPNLVTALRETLKEHGAEVRFEAKLEDFLIENGRLIGVKLLDGETIKAQATILATGHSARDVFELLQKRGVEIEAKPFAMGVRIEHPQSLIDSIQYHCDNRGAYLPAASYSLVQQVRYNGEDAGVFSFCMCPGGFIVPAATAQGEVVVNGMSPSRRDSRFANSGIVVAVGPKDWQPLIKKFGSLAGLEYQRIMEQKACLLAGNRQSAPAQRLSDFLRGKVSSNFPDCSYQPGLSAVDMKEVLYPEIYHRLKVGFEAFGKKMRGYSTQEAVLVGVESRTSSPVKIPRDAISCEHISLKGLYPCGEGGGYAGGIVSAAMDGERVALAIGRKLGVIA